MKDLFQPITVKFHPSVIAEMKMLSEKYNVPYTTFIRRCVMVALNHLRPDSRLWQKEYSESQKAWSRSHGGYLANQAANSDADPVMSLPLKFNNNDGTSGNQLPLNRAERTPGEVAVSR
jgi:hypothetical protein